MENTHTNVVMFAHRKFAGWASSSITLINNSHHESRKKKLIMSCRLMQPCNQPTKCRMGFIVDHSRAIPRKKIEKEKTNDVMSFDVTCKIFRFLSTVGHGIVHHKSHTGFGLKYRLVSDTQSSPPEDPHNPHVHPHHRTRGSYV